MAAIAYFMATRTEGAPRSGWRIIGGGAFVLHGLSVVGVIGTLFYLIYTHQYQFHYVWSHSSNELPVHYMISCFWEGQEGSFLLWTFWHVVLGTILLVRGREWRDVVMAVIASVNLILASMILGINLELTTAQVVASLVILVPAGYLLWRWLGNRTANTWTLLHLLAALVAGLSVYLVVSEKGGSFRLSELGNYFNMEGIGYVAAFALILTLIGYFGIYLVYGLLEKNGPRLHARELFSVSMVIAMGLAALFVAIAPWKVGSSPFILLRDAMPDAPVFVSNPNFVPSNGTGLNPLLQNYWMVIHPPTLFLGFASTVVPFAFVVGGLVTGRYKEWMRPAAPWTIFSVMILGVGIIMGGYWAYETLNFGGYWNWDPVENSSFVPWIFGIASLHAMLAYRKGRVFLQFSMLLVISSFIFVLYSTFLTRSGILGETSVHTFTDLGLSGQLLALLFVYLFGIFSLFLARNREFPESAKRIVTNSAEFMLFLGVLTLVGVGIVISIFTSIPVFNQVLGTNMATPKDGPFFYYQWTIWFTIALGAFSGLAQFFYWRKLEKRKLSNAIMRPYLLAIVVAFGIIAAIAFATDWEFAFEDRYREWKDLADNSSSTLRAVFRYIRLGFFVFADELLLFASLFMLFANVDVLMRLLRRNRKTRTVTGGAIAHVGFALMLLGFLFSSGYDQILSKNVNPGELAALPQDARIDNVALEKGRPRDILDYRVTYVGKKEARPPISDLEILQEDGMSFKASFRDSTGDQFAIVMPVDVFTSEIGDIDLAKVETFLNEKITFLKPSHINDRSLYGLRFVPRKLNPAGEVVFVEEKGFTLYPEAEVNSEMGLIAHPSRKILPFEDIYVHVSTIPKEEDPPKFKYYHWDATVGDTFQTVRAMIIFEKVTSEPVEGTGYELIAKAHLKIMTDWGQPFKAEPLYRIDTQGRVTVKDQYVEPIYTSFVFAAVDPQNKVIKLQAQELQNPPDDMVVIQVLKKPFINLLWLGTFILTFGFIVAMLRRIRENRGHRDVQP